MGSDDDFLLIGSTSSSHPHHHAHTRQTPTDQTSINESNIDRHDGDYYPHHQAPFEVEDEDEDESDLKKSVPGAPIPAKRTSPYYHKKLRSDPVASNKNESESENGSYRKEWSDTAIACLLDAFTEKYNQLNRGNLRGRDWEEVAGGNCDTVRFYYVLVNADAVLKGTSVNGVYDCHSGKDHVSYGDVISRGITSMDLMALTHCEENGIPGWSCFIVLNC